jgi:hypothetical protein
LLEHIKQIDPKAHSEVLEVRAEASAETPRRTEAQLLGAISRVLDSSFHRQRKLWRRDSGGDGVDHEERMREVEQRRSLAEECGGDLASPHPGA